MIEQNSVDNVKAQIDIVDVVGNYIELKKSGANFKANCPFHGENTPSFVVSPSKQIFHCFGCGVGGDAIKFIMDYENLNYRETIEKLASMYNIQLQYSKSKENNTQDRKIIENLNIFYRKVLDQHNESKQYLLNRGVYESSIEKFELGFAPESSKTMQLLSQNGVDINEAKEIGLVASSDDGRSYARFSNRITFPIHTPTGKLVGFGGRIISNRTDIGKYINSPQSKIFDKSRLLYGYHKARQAIFQKNEIIIVEGNLDVIMLHQAGFVNTVATLGTALTASHIPIIQKGEPKIILAYDGDKAGVAAAFKASSMLSQKSFKGGVVIFPQNLDPADMVKNGKLDELNKLFHKPRPFIEFCIESILKRFNLNDPLQKEDALKMSVDYIRTLSSLLQDEYKNYLASTLGINRSHIKIKPSLNQPIKTDKTKEDFAELSIIKTLIVKPHFIDIVLDSIDADIFQTHKEEFSTVIKGKTDELLNIQIRDDISVYDEDELKGQLILFLRKYYQLELIKIKRVNSLTLSQKSFIIRKIQNILLKLQRGELVPHESFSTI